MLWPSFLIQTTLIFNVLGFVNLLILLVVSWDHRRGLTGGVGSDEVCNIVDQLCLARPMQCRVI